MSEKVLRLIIYFVGIFCFCIFLAVRIEPLFNALLLEKYIPEYWENTKWGELYYLNQIKHFREEGLPEYRVKYRFTDKHPKLAEADILAFGDSFFDFSRMVTFPEQLSDSLQKKVFYARDKMPLDYLYEHNYRNDEKKILIYETAERFLPGRFSNTHKVSEKVAEISEFKKLAHKIRILIFPYNVETNLSMLLSRSYFTTYLYSQIATLKFDLFKQISPHTPIYYLDGDRPWLFGGDLYGDGPNGFSHKHSEEDIETYCNNIQLLASDLREKYNLEMVFMIIPSKYTIYHNLVNVPDSAYGGFIPMIYNELDRRGVPVVKIYNEFISQRDQKLLFYGTDTHWTEEALHISLHKTIQKLDSLNSIDYTAKINNKNTSDFQQN